MTLLDDVKKYAYLLFPLLAGITGRFALRNLFPAIMGLYNYGPAYAHLIDGLNIATDHFSRHMDHTGTICI